MSGRDELAQDIDHVLYSDSYYGDMFRNGHSRETLIDAILAAGWRKLVLDDATVERASEMLLDGYEWCQCRRSPFDKHDIYPPCSTRVLARQTARAVLAAAVKEES